MSKHGGLFLIDWTELDVERCEILEEHDRILKIRHPDSGRPKYFQTSQSGNWYWIGPKRDNGTKKGFIIKEDPR